MVAMMMMMIKMAQCKQGTIPLYILRMVSVESHNRPVKYLLLSYWLAEALCGKDGMWTQIRSLRSGDMLSSHFYTAVKLNRTKEGT